MSVFVGLLSEPKGADGVRETKKTPFKCRLTFQFFFILRGYNLIIYCLSNTREEPFELFLI